jgi:predicted deacetylase
MSTRSLVVSIHDVSPLTRASVATILSHLLQTGIPRVSLLVIPDHHHRGNITAAPGFASWLRDLVAAGHEPVLHGYTHQRQPRSHESFPTRVITRHYTAGEGEFFDIPFQEARDLLARGRDDLTQAAGRVPTGFIAPAWLLSPPAEDAARDLNFAYTTRLQSISDLATRQIHHSQSLCWSVRAPWRRIISLAWNHLLFLSLRPNPLLRLSIHPPDFTHPPIARQIQHLAARALEDRTPVTYHDFIAQTGPSPNGTKLSHLRAKGLTPS